MSLRIIHLRKLLKIFYLPNPAKISAIRSEIRDDIARENGIASAGGDFYAPFWSDAKHHVLGGIDLYDSVDERIEANGSRENLYPKLRDGFLLWWNDRRRWTNEPFVSIDAPKGRYKITPLNAIIKVENFLSVVDGIGLQHFVYPYFAPNPELSDESARLGLWLIGRALPDLGWDEIRILDVIRGITFAIDKNPLLGNEEAIFERKYVQILQLHDKLREEYF